MPIRFHKATTKIINQQKSKKSVNNLFDNEFIIDDTKWDVSFSDTNLSTESKIYLRHAIVQLCGGYGDNNSLDIKSNKRVKEDIRTFFGFIEYLKKTNVVNFIEEFDDKSYLDYLEYCLVEKEYSRATLLAINTIFRKISGLHVVGELNWFTSLPPSWSDASNYLKKIYEKHFPNKDVLEWLWGGSFETISFTTSMYMLAYSIQELESNLHCILSAYFSTTKDLGEKWLICYNKILNHMKVAIGNETTDVDQIAELLNRGKSKLKIHQGIHKAAALKASTGLELWMKKTNELLPDDRKKYTTSTFLKVIKDLNFSPRNLSELVRKMHQCSLAIIAILTGYRAHELANMKGLALTEKKGEILVTTDIDKTHFGFPVSRSSNSTVEMAINSLLDLSYMDKTQKISYTVDGAIHEGYPSLFFNGAMRSSYRIAMQQRENYQPHLKKIPPAIWIEQQYKDTKKYNRCAKLNIMLNAVFDRTLDSLPTNLAEEIKQSETVNGKLTITIHGCRHLFADYLLRRFEGDIFRAVRRHFAHSSKNVLNFTLAYIRNKIAPIERRRCEIAYTKELIKRMVGDVNHTMFTGNSVEYVRKYLDKFSWKTTEELDFLLDEWLNDEDEGLERIVPHSYGFCLLFKNRIKQAKCLDKQGVAKVDRGDSSTCVGSGCANLAVDADSHLATLQQIKVTHENILASINNKDGLMSLLKGNNNIRFKRSSRTIQVINALESQLGLGQG